MNKINFTENKAEAEKSVRNAIHNQVLSLIQMITTLGYNPRKVFESYMPLLEKREKQIMQAADEARAKGLKLEDKEKYQ